jgi:hypothetical protein
MPKKRPPHLLVQLTDAEAADLDRRSKEEDRTKSAIVKRALWPKGASEDDPQSAV